ncbi:MAG TPA: flavin reductase family protein [Clostridiales bacterium]|nr:flavin reductase family protein [Clostridiales bacterium]
MSVPRIQLNPATVMAPVPVVLVSCRGPEGSEYAKPNLITLAWAGIVCSEPPMVSISVRKSRYSHRQIQESGEFVINLVNEKLLRQTDFCGVKSGRDIDKFAACHLTACPAAAMLHAPAVAESPLSLSCQVRQVLELGSHDCFIGEIVAVEAAADLMDEKNKLCLDRAGLVAYCHGDYRSLGSILGFFGYSVAGDEVLARRMPKKAARRSPAKGKKSD